MNKVESECFLLKLPQKVGYKFAVSSAWLAEAKKRKYSHVTQSNKHKGIKCVNMQWEYLASDGFGSSHKAQWGI